MMLKQLQDKFPPTGTQSRSPSGTAGATSVFRLPYPKQPSPKRLKYRLADIFISGGARGYCAGRTVSSGVSFGPLHRCQNHMESSAVFVLQCAAVSELAPGRIDGAKLPVLARTGLQTCARRQRVDQQKQTLPRGPSMPAHL